MHLARHAHTPAVVGVLLMLTGCNGFSESYTGQRFPAVTDATVVHESPPESQACLIGESAFATTDQFQGDSQAIEAACAVGANFVQWDRAWDGQETRLESMPIYQRGIANRGTFVTYVELPSSKSKWRYYARYWRSRALGDAAPAAPAAPGG